MIDIDEKTLNAIYEWALNDGKPTRYAGMSYEDGLRDMVDFLQGNMTLEELLDQ